MKNIIPVIFLTFIFTKCTGIPDDLAPVSGFELSRYLGTWYEIARLDHSFERGLSHVTATYSLLKDGGVQVINRGFHDEDQEWKEAEGKAFFVDRTDTGRLKVSFFGPFYGGYNIIKLDRIDYKYSVVCGSNKDYLWILARKPVMQDSLLYSISDSLQGMGFETHKLIYVKQDIITGY